MLAQARSVVVLTGAGVSAQSGLSTFRDAQTGLWARYDPMELAHIDAFHRDPELVTRWYHARFEKCLSAQPNPGHNALASLEHRLASAGRTFTLITQNIDRLHQRAGSRNVVEIHGNILTWRCTKTGREQDMREIPFDTFPPRSAAGALLRPNVVWFGEMLPQAAVEASQAALSSCDLFLSIGTSAVVWPAAGFIEVARSRGAATVEINRDPTPVSAGVDISIRGLSGEVLPGILTAMSVPTP